MSAISQRGGIPIHVNGTTGVATLQVWGWNQQGAAGGPTNHLWFKNVGAGPITLSLDLDSATASVGITLAAGAVWEGPAEVGTFWTRSAGAQAFESVAFVRRG